MWLLHYTVRTVRMAFPWLHSPWLRDKLKSNSIPQKPSAETFFKCPLPALHLWQDGQVFDFSPPVRWGLLDFMSAVPPPHLPSSAGPQLQAQDQSVPRWIPTASSGSKCSPPELNHKSPKIYQIECQNRMTDRMPDNIARTYARTYGRKMPDRMPEKMPV